MDDSTPQQLSRRQWLGLVSSASAVLAAADVAAQSPAASPSPAKPKDDLGSRIYNVCDYGAKGDGTTPDTAALQAAIDACHTDQGGIVLVPAGVFVTGTVELKSNVTLRIAPGGKLLGSLDGTQYHPADAIPLSGDTTLVDGNVALIFAVRADNIGVEGPGTIDGQGAAFRRQPGYTTPAGISGHHRPYHMLFYQCTNIRVHNIFLQHCAYHSIRAAQCRFAWFTAIHIFSRVTGNNDGFHFISCEHVHLSDTTVLCEDDACAMFGSCKWITIDNCVFSTRWSVFRFGGGTVDNIAVSNCVIFETYGCPIKMHGEPGSFFSNVSFSNLVMTDVTGPISIDLGDFQRPPGTPAEFVRNISFNGIHAVVSPPAQLPDCYPLVSHNPAEILACIRLNALGNAYMENISFNDVHITYPGGGTADQGANRNLPEKIGEYYATGVPPAYGIWARNVKGLTMQDIRFEVKSPDQRPAVVFDHVIDCGINGISAQGDPGAESLMRFMESQDILVTAPRVLTPAPAFLRVEGPTTTNLIVEKGDLTKATTPLTFSDDVKKENVTLRS